MLDQKIKRRLIDIVGENGLTDGEAVQNYAIDEVIPQAVVYPGTASEVENVVIAALEDGLTIVPWGGGTQMGLGFPPRRADLVVAMNRLNQVEDLDHENMTVTVAAGVHVSDLQAKLHEAGTGFFLPLDPPQADGVTMGGLLATNTSGPRRLLYGTLRDLALGVDVVIAEQLERRSKVQAGGKTAKNVSGYDMSKLYIGSMGTLAIIVSATLKILPLPPERASILGRFEEAAAAWSFTGALEGTQLVPSCVEVYNDQVATILPVNGTGSSEGSTWVAVGLEGIEEAVEREIQEIDTMMRAEGAQDVVVLKEADEVTYWTALGLLSKGVREKHDCSIGVKASVPLSRLHEVSGMIENEATKIGVTVYQQGHAGNGIGHAHLAMDRGVYSDNEQRLAEMVTALRQQVNDMEGSLVVEYAPAAFKQKVDVWGDVGLAFTIMERLKREFDPKNILNPGRFVGGI
jgi:glycolate oxidase FAD binding subunit